mmetsp:Transcript_11793/g.45694  ORF Transcript_11793/g.45694 Transcript_11793/m.45694 type:complete len:90 (+) Transcript_11793:433-702(+)
MCTSMYVQPSQGRVLRGSDRAQMRLEPLEMMDECVAKCSTRLQYFERGRGDIDVVLGRVLRARRRSHELIVPLPSPISGKPPAVVVEHF